MQTKGRILSTEKQKRDSIMNVIRRKSNKRKVNLKVSVSRPMTLQSHTRKTAIKTAAMQLQVVHLQMDGSTIIYLHAFLMGIIDVSNNVEMT